MEAIVKRGIPTRAGTKVKGFGERPGFDATRTRRAPRLLQTQGKSLISGYLQQSFSQSLVANISREAGRKIWTRWMTDGIFNFLS